MSATVRWEYGSTLRGVSTGYLLVTMPTITEELDRGDSQKQYMFFSRTLNFSQKIFS